MKPKPFPSSKNSITPVGMADFLMVATCVRVVFCRGVGPILGILIRCGRIAFLAG
jgi:hypothetical protein